MHIPTLESSTIITLITLSAFNIGYQLLIVEAYVSMIIIVTSFIPLILFKSQKPLSQKMLYALTTFIFGLVDCYCYSHIEPFMIYLIVLTIYFYGQFQLVNCFHHQSLCWNSFLIYHSRQFTISNIVMVIQHVITRYWFNYSYKHHHILMVPAGVIMICGLLLRIAAFFTAKSNFTHIIRSKKDPKHQLVTNGVYGFFRHPSYTGYFYFVVGSMIYIGNFFCAFSFALILRRFFSARIQFEEYTLYNFFPEYDQYKKRTYIFIPFVKGYSSKQNID